MVLTHLRNPHVLGLVLNDHLLEEVIFLGPAHFLRCFPSVLLLHALRVQIVQIDLVTVLVFKSVQRAVRPLLE